MNPDESGAQEELHLDTSDLDHIMVGQWVGLCIQALAVDRGKLAPLDMRDEIAMRPLGNDGDRQAGLAQCGQGFGQLQFLAGIGPIEQLDSSANRRYRRLGLRNNANAGACHRIGFKLQLRRHLELTGADRRVALKIARCCFSLQVCHVFELVFTEFDDVVVAQEMLLDRLAIDQRTVGAVEVFEEGVGQNGDDYGVIAGNGEIVDLDVVMRLASDGQALLVKRDLLENQPVHRQDQFCHLVFLVLLQ